MKTSYEKLQDFLRSINDEIDFISLNTTSGFLSEDKYKIIISKNLISFSNRYCRTPKNIYISLSSNSSDLYLNPYSIEIGISLFHDIQNNDETQIRLMNKNIISSFDTHSDILDLLYDYKNSIAESMRKIIGR